MDNQIKYLNFYKVIANFSTNIIGVFVPLLIYKQLTDPSGTFQLSSQIALICAFSFFCGEILLRTLFNIVFKRLYLKYPQIFLLVRVVPLVTYVLCVFLLNINIVLGAVLVGVFLAMFNSFGSLPIENIFNYSSKEKTGSKLGLTRLLEYGGSTVAVVAGGLFLDIQTYIVIIIAVVTYLISVIPLLIYFFKERKSPVFNQEYVSNAMHTYEQIKIKNIQLAGIRKKLTWSYAFVYFLYCVLDTLPTIMTMFMFASGTDSYLYASYIFALQNLTYGLGSILIAKIDAKKDITIFVSASAVIIASLVCVIPFTANILWVMLMLSAIIGFLYAPISYFALERMLAKSRIVGISGEAESQRYIGVNMGQAAPALVCLSGFILPGFFLSAAMLLVCAIFIPINEERNRHRIVDYLNNNHMYDGSI